MRSQCFVLPFLAALAVLNTAAAAESIYLEAFEAGMECYHQQDFICAQEEFATAAWEAGSELQRAPALFNLGNAHFFNAEFKQAAILYREAGLLGVDEQLVEVNLSFANSLADSMQQEVEALKKSAFKAQWRAEASELPDELVERLANGIYISGSGGLAEQSISAQQLEQLINASVERFNASLSGNQSAYQQRWVERRPTEKPGSTAQLFNRLLPLELGLPNRQTPVPVELEGQRPW